MTPARLLPVLLALALAACTSAPPYVYQYVPGRTATLENGAAIPPPNAPERVRIGIAAANRIAGMPYRYGGGHRSFLDTGYDCSGASSFVLNAMGLLGRPTTSRALREFGQRGEGDWVTIYARKNHVFLVLAGLRFDTGYGSGEGPQWTTRTRPADGHVLRHPAGL